MKNTSLTLSMITILALQQAYADTDINTTNPAAELDPIVVSSDLRKAKDKDIAVSTTVKDQVSLQDEGATHFEDVILEIPNVNYSGQDSRPRHIQIRGMGERDEYTGAPNASVGFMMDEIDFSSVGMIGSLFDTKQVEVLRGPQGTRYGANALAGLINIQTNDPSDTFEGMVEATGGQDNLREFGAVISGPFSQEANSPLYRLTIQKHDSDGFRDNAYLGRSDTNGRDELNIRGKLRFTPNSDTTIDVTLIHADLNNGYDAWSLDNSFTTLSNEPGEDSQKTNAAAVKIKSTANKNFDLISTTTISDSDMTYSYDGDWVYPGYWASYSDFRYMYHNAKKHKTLSQEFRLVSTPESKLFNGTTDWLLGCYGAQIKENNTVNQYGDDLGWGAWESALESRYKVNKYAVFGQLNYEIDPQTSLSTGIRVEKHSSDYTNSYAESFSPDDTMLGGHIELSHKLNEEETVYAAISQGYKAGGFNMGLDPLAPRELLSFKKETATNYEIGIKHQSASLKASLNAFYTDRNNPQFDGYTYVGAYYTYYTENFDKATNYGIEGDFDWKVDENWNLFGSLGLLQTTIDGQSMSGAFTIDGREQSHAPNYQYSIGAQYRHDNGFFARVSMRGMDAFYFDNTHDAKSKAYNITDARIGYETADWEVYLWGRNLFDEKYATRGFFFANEPTYTNTETYVRLGDPRQIGVTARYHF